MRAQVPFFAGAASEFVELFVGVGASRVRDLFEKVPTLLAQLLSLGFPLSQSVQLRTLLSHISSAGFARPVGLCQAVRRTLYASCTGE